MSRRQTPEAGQSWRKEWGQYVAPETPAVPAKRGPWLLYWLVCIDIGALAALLVLR